MLFSWSGQRKSQSSQPVIDSSNAAESNADNDHANAKRKHTSPAASLDNLQKDCATKRPRPRSVESGSGRCSIKSGDENSPSSPHSGNESDCESDPGPSDTSTDNDSITSTTEKENQDNRTRDQQYWFWSWFGYSSKTDISQPYTATNTPVDAVTSLPVDTTEYAPVESKPVESDPTKCTPEESVPGESTMMESAPSNIEAIAPTDEVTRMPSPSTSWRSYFFTPRPTESNNMQTDTQDSGEAGLRHNILRKPEEQSLKKDYPEQQPLTPIPDKTKNMVVPSFDSQFSTESGATSTTLFGRALNAINSIFMSDHQSTGTRFIETIKANPGSIGSKRFVVVGVHGWFPIKVVRSMIGEPTGTSLKFCEQMVAGVKHYFSEHGIEVPDECITMIPLLYEGKVEERVAVMYRDLVNTDAWVDALRSADTIIWATHSQGTPVSTMLLHKLLDDGYINVDRQSACFLAMAGIAHGPFPALKESLIVRYVEADAARELFEFMNPDSDVSQKFSQSMAHILRSGIKAVLVGSMQDQVVPLYSAIMSGITHPNILRAIYIDGHIYSEDDFLINLISFALQLRNAGLSDHGLLNHISEVLAGNLYSLEGGHSTIYEEREVYVTAVRYLFETAPLGNRNPSRPVARAIVASDSKRSTLYVDAHMDAFQAKVRLNPYFLPWAMRGIFDDPRVLGDEHFSRELERLQLLFDHWNPGSAKLREIKFRLEPLKARL